MTPKPKILLTNDDGADAPGLWALFKEIAAIAEPIIVAPVSERSASGHAITVRRPMALSEIQRDGRRVGFRLDGTPADCVKLAVTYLYPNQLAMVISGINWGANVGNNVIYSGTVAAAIEAAMFGLPSMAVSLRDEAAPPVHFETAARVARRLALDLLANPLPRGTTLNVNVPNLPLRKIAGFRVARQGTEIYTDHFVAQQDPDGKVHVSNLGDQRLPTASRDQHYDDHALADRRISLTPLHYNLTHHAAIETLQERLAQLDWAADAAGKTRRKSSAPRNPAQS
ncbi:MAG: 5'/3'-nucleotidase SurE [Candidatus Sumerlaeia bacterium]|nr:5'/3'-nucleotidase SurE [Candidatus Sumerlaeia bacterium]